MTATRMVEGRPMADKISNVTLPDGNYDLKFLTDHYPAAYGIDRTAGTHPIRQELDNLQDAGSLYGNIIYHKAPIVMRQMEQVIGAGPFRQGLQLFTVALVYPDKTDTIAVYMNARVVHLLAARGKPAPRCLILNANGYDYARFVMDGRALPWLAGDSSGRMGAVTRAADQISSIYWRFLLPAERDTLAAGLENGLWQTMLRAPLDNGKKLLFRTYSGIVLSREGEARMYAIWKDRRPPAGVKLSEDDYTGLAAGLALREYPGYGQILQEQAGRIQNSDRKERWQFLLPALSADTAERDRFLRRSRTRSIGGRRPGC